MKNSIFANKHAKTIATVVSPQPSSLERLSSAKIFVTGPSWIWSASLEARVAEPSYLTESEGFDDSQTDAFKSSPLASGA